MLRSKACIFSAAFTIFIRAALAQTTHNVTVGVQGSFFDPPTLAAALNDTINFIFVGPDHSVVQAAWNNPCFPLFGGFSSGLVLVNNSAATSIWSLTVTNVTTAIWFYCGNTEPFSHCASGMVGAINPPSQASFQEYLAAAKLVSAPLPPVSLSLTGQGAFATAPPATPTPAVPTATTSAPVSSTNAPTSTRKSAVPTATSLSSPKPGNGAVIGGSVAGGVVFLVILAFFAFLLHRRFKRHERRGSKDFFRYKAKTPRFGGPSSEDFNPAKLVSPPTDRSRSLATKLPASNFSSPASVPSVMVPLRTSPATHPTGLSNGAISTSRKSKIPTTTIPSARRLPPPPNTAPNPAPPAAHPFAAQPPPPPPLIDKKLPLAPLAIQSVAAPPPEHDATSPDIHMLAREVAAVLMQSPQGELPPRGGSRNSSSIDSINRTESPAPPRYRASVL